MAEPNMMLPVGKTCDDCRHFGICTALLGSVAGNMQCAWSPSRFVQRMDAARAARLRERAGTHRLLNADGPCDIPHLDIAIELEALADELEREK